MRVSILALTALVSAAPAAAIEQINSVQSFGFETANRNAPVKVQTGQRGDLSYTARSIVVGKTATAGVGGGDECGSWCVRMMRALLRVSLWV